MRSSLCLGRLSSVYLCLFLTFQPSLSVPYFFAISVQLSPSGPLPSGDNCLSLPSGSLRLSLTFWLSPSISVISVCPLQSGYLRLSASISVRLSIRLSQFPLFPSIRGSPRLGVKKRGNTDVIVHWPWVTTTIPQDRRWKCRYNLVSWELTRPLDRLFHPVLEEMGGCSRV